MRVQQQIQSDPLLRRAATNSEHVSVSPDELDLLARRDPAKRRCAPAEQDHTGVAGQVPSLIQLNRPLLVEAVDVAAVDVDLAHPGPLGLDGQFSAILLSLETDRRCLDPHGQVLGHQRDRAPFGGEVQCDRQNARVVVAEAEAVRQRSWIGVVQLDANGAAQIVDRNGGVQAPVNHPEVVKVAQGRTGEVAQLAVVALALKLADHHNRSTTSCSSKRRIACGSLSKTDVSMT